MVRALENPGTDPTYLEFFGFTRPPFARLSRPSQLFHTEQYSLLMAHLASATAQPDSLVVVCGANGSGKTTLLNHYIASLGDGISFAAIDETCNGEKQFHCAFLRQLGFSDITGTSRELRRITKEYLVHRGMAGDPVLILIDNAHLINPTVLEQLRLISAIKVKDRRVISVVLAGNSDLMRIMDSPAMSQIKFRSHVRFNIRVYSEEETANYVWQHLRMAGGNDVVKFSNEAHPLIYRYTGGIPNLINMLCNDVLTEAYAQQSRVITEDLVRTVADDRRLMPHVVPLQGKGRRRTDPDFKPVQPERQTQERITATDSTTEEEVEKPAPRPETPGVDSKKLLEHLSQLSKQVGELRADRMQALRNIGTRDQDISELHNKLNLQTAESEKLASALGDNTDEIERLNQALSDSTKALQKSEQASKKLATDLEKDRSAAIIAQTDIAKAKAIAEELSDLKSELQAAVSDLTTEQTDIAKAKAIAEELSDLKSELQAAVSDLTAEQIDIAKAKATAEELGRLKSELQAAVSDLTAEQTDIAKANATAAELSDLKSELQAAVSDLTAEQTDIAKAKATAAELSDLKSELQAAVNNLTAEQIDIAKAKATAEELGRLKSELRAAVSDLTADFKLADERGVRIDALEKNTAALMDEIEKKAGELDSRDETLGDLVELLQKSQHECASLRRRVTALKDREKSVSEGAVIVAAHNENLDSSNAVAQFEQAIESVSAYQTLKKTEVATYNGLINTYKRMIEQGYSDQQIKDALRVRMAELLEQRLHGASDEAVITYIRLIVDQLEEFQIQGADLCFKMMVPQTGGDSDVSPVISEKTSEREIAALDMTLRTYDANRQIPTEDDVWPDIEPIFAKLFETYGEDNVSALYDPLAPNIDKVMVYHISRSLYSEILKLPQNNAVNAMRWLLWQ